MTPLIPSTLTVVRPHVKRVLQLISNSLQQSGRKFPSLYARAIGTFLISISSQGLLNPLKPPCIRIMLKLLVFSKYCLLGSSKLCFGARSIGVCWLPMGTGGPRHSPYVSDRCGSQAVIITLPHAAAAPDHTADCHLPYCDP